MPDTIPVRFRDCSCPGTPHPEGDVAELRPYLDYPGGAEALASITVTDEEGNSSLLPIAEWPPIIGPVYMRRGIVSWNVQDDNGPVPVTREALEALSFEDAYELADQADTLYSERMLSPLVRRMEMFSKAGPISESTQPRRKSSPKRRSRSRSSS
jgi:hypothetical protein